MEELSLICNIYPENNDIQNAMMALFPTHSLKALSYYHNQFTSRNVNQISISENIHVANVTDNLLPTLQLTNMKLTGAKSNFTLRMKEEWISCLRHVVFSKCLVDFATFLPTHETWTKSHLESITIVRSKFAIGKDMTSFVKIVHNLQDFIVVKSVFTQPSDSLHAYNEFEFAKCNLRKIQIEDCGGNCGLLFS